MHARRRRHYRPSCPWMHTLQKHARQSTCVIATPYLYGGDHNPPYDADGMWLLVCLLQASSQFKCHCASPLTNQDVKVQCFYAISLVDEVVRGIDMCASMRCTARRTRLAIAI